MVLPDRFNLNHRKDPTEGVSVWKLIKNCIGQDLTRLTLPVDINEPMTILQKFADLIEYHDLLMQAGKENDDLLRFVNVVALNIAQLASTEGRFTKPFNPLLCETFELRHPDYDFFSEQVSHHPPISAAICKARNNEFEVISDSELKIGFWGNSIDLKGVGATHIRLPKYNELYSVDMPNTCVYNIVIGT